MYAQNFCMTVMCVREKEENFYTRKIENNVIIYYRIVHYMCICCEIWIKERKEEEEHNLRAVLSVSYIRV